jgi:hypothetical protein
MVLGKRGWFSHLRARRQLLLAAHLSHSPPRGVGEPRSPQRVYTGLLCALCASAVAFVLSPEKLTRRVRSGAANSHLPHKLHKLSNRIWFPIVTHRFFLPYALLLDDLCQLYVRKAATD